VDVERSITGDKVRPSVSHPEPYRRGGTIPLALAVNRPRSKVPKVAQEQTQRLPFSKKPLFSSAKKELTKPGAPLVRLFAFTLLKTFPAFTWLSGPQMSAAEGPGGQCLNAPGHIGKHQCQNNHTWVNGDGGVCQDHSSSAPAQ
jgi:hypothetical protein